MTNDNCEPQPDVENNQPPADSQPEETVVQEEHLQEEEENVKEENVQQENVQEENAQEENVQEKEADEKEEKKEEEEVDDDDDDGQNGPKEADASAIDDATRASATLDRFNACMQSPKWVAGLDLASLADLAAVLRKAVRDNDARANDVTEALGAFVADNRDILGNDMALILQVLVTICGQTSVGKDAVLQQLLNMFGAGLTGDTVVTRSAEQIRIRRDQTMTVADGVQVDLTDPYQDPPRRLENLTLQEAHTERHAIHARLKEQGIGFGKAIIDVSIRAADVDRAMVLLNLPGWMGQGAAQDKAPREIFTRTDQLITNMNEISDGLLLIVRESNGNVANESWPHLNVVKKANLRIPCVFVFSKGDLLDRPSGMKTFKELENILFGPVLQFVPNAHCVIASAWRHDQVKNAALGIPAHELGAGQLKEMKEKLDGLVKEVWDNATLAYKNSPAFKEDERKFRARFGTPNLVTLVDKLCKAEMAKPISRLCTAMDTCANTMLADAKSYLAEFRALESPKTGVHLYDFCKRMTHLMPAFYLGKFTSADYDLEAPFVETALTATEELDEMMSLRLNSDVNDDIATLYRAACAKGDDRLSAVFFDRRNRLEEIAIAAVGSTETLFLSDKKRQVLVEMPHATLAEHSSNGTITRDLLAKITEAAKLWSSFLSHFVTFQVHSTIEHLAEAALSHFGPVLSNDTTLTGHIRSTLERVFKTDFKAFLDREMATVVGTFVCVNKLPTSLDDAVREKRAANPGLTEHEAVVAVMQEYFSDRLSACIRLMFDSAVSRTVSFFKLMEERHEDTEKLIFKHLVRTTLKPTVLLETLPPKHSRTAKKLLEAVREQSKYPADYQLGVERSYPPRMCAPEVVESQELERLNLTGFICGWNRKLPDALRGDYNLLPTDAAITTCKELLTKKFGDNMAKRQEIINKAARVLDRTEGVLEMLAVADEYIEKSLGVQTSHRFGPAAAKYADEHATISDELKDARDSIQEEQKEEQQDPGQAADN